MTGSAEICRIDQLRTIGTDLRHKGVSVKKTALLRLYRIDHGKSGRGCGTRNVNVALTVRSDPLAVGFVHITAAQNSCIENGRRLRIQLRDKNEIRKETWSSPQRPDGRKVFRAGCPDDVNVPHRVGCDFRYHVTSAPAQT